MLARRRCLATLTARSAPRLPHAASAASVLDAEASGRISYTQRVKREPVDRRVMELIQELGVAMPQHRPRRRSKSEFLAEREATIQHQREAFNVLGNMGLKHATIQAAEAPEAAAVELAFAGRSNVGKSSLLNALTGKRCGTSGTIGIASVANRPGVTRSLNFYRNEVGAQLVDLPGYGFAHADEELVAQWQAEMRSFLAQRGGPLYVILVVDARQSLKQSDRDFLLWLDREAQVPVHVVMSKCDLIQAVELCKRYTVLGSDLRALQLRHWVPPHHMVSSKTMNGVELFRAALSTGMPEDVLKRQQKKYAKQSKAWGGGRQGAPEDRVEAAFGEVTTPAARDFAQKVLARQSAEAAENKAKAKTTLRQGTLVQDRRARREVAFGYWVQRAKRREVADELGTGGTSSSLSSGGQRRR